MIPKPALTPGLSLYYYISHLCYNSPSPSSHPAQTRAWGWGEAEFAYVMKAYIHTICITDVTANKRLDLIFFEWEGQ